MEQIYTPKQDYKVLVNCMTYNQSKYIEDALNGFAMQHTNFPFACLVMDDCSTDGEQEVIKAWMERECDMEKAEYIDFEFFSVILVPHKTNTNCTFAFYLLKRNLWKELALKDKLCAPWREHCEYEAMCEGDDYWTNVLKLQKQVDFLEDNADYSLIHSDYSVFTQKTSTLYHPSKKWPSGFVLSELIVGNYNVSTLTSMFRMASYKKCPNLYEGQNFLMGDLPLWIELASVGKVKYMDEKTGVYRVLESSSAHSSDCFKTFRFIQNAYDIRRYYANNFNLEVSELENNRACSYLKIAYMCNDEELTKQVISLAKPLWPKLPLKYKLLYFITQNHLLGGIFNKLYKVKR